MKEKKIRLGLVDAKMHMLFAPHLRLIIPSYTQWRNDPWSINWRWMFNGNFEETNVGKYNFRWKAYQYYKTNGHRFYYYFNK